jgi:hypothetical protein
MKLQQVKFVLAALWMMLAVGVVAALGTLRTPADMLALAVLALTPPAAMWFWWNDPAQTMSERIHAVRRNDTGPDTIRS